jgi:cysteine synthase A
MVTGHVRHTEKVLSGKSHRHKETFESTLQAIGNIPMVELKKINDTKCRIFAKLEFMNPSGSVKDRMVAHMLDMAEERGILKKGGSIVEATSGNTGIAFAMMCAARGYKFIAVMPDNMTGERIKMMRAFGARVVLTPEWEDMKGAVRVAMRISARTGAWHPNQFTNRDNTEVHKLTTGREIISQMHGRVDAFVAGVGTGGTLMGVAEAFRGKGIKAKIIAVEPAESAVMSGRSSGMHRIQGIGEGFVPSLVDMRMIDEVIAIESEDAEDMTARLAAEEGLLCGVSSGANVLASLQAARKLGKGSRVVTLLPDRGERYLSTGVFG